MTPSLEPTKDLEWALDMLRRVKEYRDGDASLNTTDYEDAGIVVAAAYRALEKKLANMGSRALEFQKGWANAEAELFQEREAKEKDKKFYEHQLAGALDDRDKQLERAESMEAALRGLVDAADMATDLCRCGIVDHTCIGCEALNLALTAANEFWQPTLTDSKALEKKEST